MRIPFVDAAALKMKFDTGPLSLSFLEFASTLDI